MQTAPATHRAGFVAGAFDLNQASLILDGTNQSALPRRRSRRQGKTLIAPWRNQDFFRIA
jgi:hypothetical protein